jgi:hypothetical protein
MIPPVPWDSPCLPDGPRQPRQIFSTLEDQALSQLVKCIGPTDWNAVARQMPGRTARQCRDRWKGYLSPNLTTDAWTAEEDGVVMQKWEMLGPRWSLIAANLKGRSEVSVRNRLQLLCRRRNRDAAGAAMGPIGYSPTRDSAAVRADVSKWPSFQMPEAARTPLTTQRELEAFFNSLGPVPVQKSRLLGVR